MVAMVVVKNRYSIITVVVVGSLVGIVVSSIGIRGLITHVTVPHHQRTGLRSRDTPTTTILLPFEFRNFVDTVPKLFIVLSFLKYAHYDGFNQLNNTLLVVLW